MSDKQLTTLAFNFLLYTYILAVCAKKCRERKLKEEREQLAAFRCIALTVLGISLYEKNLVGLADTQEM
jgi:hypothetical protein